MGEYAGDESADRMCSDRLCDEAAVLETVEHGRVRTEEAAPAHTHGGENGYCIAVQDTLRREVGYQSEGCTDCSERGDREGDEAGIGEAEEPAEEEVHLVGKGRQQADAFVCFAGEGAVGSGRSVGEHHNGRTDDEYAGDDGDTEVYTRLAAVQYGIEHTQEKVLLMLFRFLVLHLLHIDRTVHFRIAAERAPLHQTSADDTTDDGSEEADDGTAAVALSCHEDDNDHTHAESRTEVGEADELIFLEVGAELAILCQRDDGGIVTKEGEDASECRHARQVVKGLHQGPEDTLEHIHDMELHEQTAQGSAQYRDTHNIEYGLEQEVIGGLHNRIEHIGQTHDMPYIAEYGEEENDEAEGFEEMTPERQFLVLRSCLHL